MALDPNPVPGPSPLTRNAQVFELAGAEMVTELPGEEVARPPPTKSKSTSRDYFAPKGSTPALHKAPQEPDGKNSSLVSNSPRESRHSSQPNSPHIAYQEVGWDPSHELVENARKRKDHTTDLKMRSTSIDAITSESPRDPSGDARSRVNGETRNGKFMLQEVPKSKKSGASSKSSRSDELSSTVDTSLPSSKPNSAPASANPQLGQQERLLPSGESLVFLRPKTSLQEQQQVLQDPKPQEHGPPDNTPSKMSQELIAGGQPHALPQRSDSLIKSKPPKPHVTRRDISVGHIASLSTAHESNGAGHDSPASAPPSTTTGHPLTGLGITEGASGIIVGSSTSSGSVTELPHPSTRSRDRDRLGLAGSIPNDSLVTSKLPPSLQAGNSKLKHESSSTQASEISRNGDHPISPKLPRYNAGGDLSMDDDMARILTNEDHQDHASFLRRVSNSVRHARSYSDRGTRLSKEPKWPKSPLNASTGPEISSPLSSSPEAREDLLWLKNELRRERQKLVEKDQRILELETALEAKSNIRQINTELREKRSTMVDLDTQKEIVVRELEVLTDHIAAVKKSGEPLDIGRMSNAVLHQFVESLQKLKDSFTPPIGDLIQQKNELIEEVSNLTQSRDNRFHEFELLSSKNAELAELNNRLVHQIQELHKANAAPSMESIRPSNGLGIYTQQKEKPPSSLDGREPKNPSIAESSQTGSTLVAENDGDSTYLTAPQVVNMRKAQPKKFWKKGVAKDITKGLKGAFTSNDQHKTQREGQYPEGFPYSSVQQNQEYSSSSLQRTQMQDPARQGFGFFNNQKGKFIQPKPAINGVVSAVSDDGVPGRSMSLEPPKYFLTFCLALFGSELEHRSEYEVGIPGIVMRCIQEVEHRGKWGSLISTQID